MDKEKIVFCQEPSKEFLRRLVEENDDPRVVMGKKAIEDLEQNGGWTPTYDARDERT